MTRSVGQNEGIGWFLKRFFIMIDITFLISHCFFKIEIVVTFLKDRTSFFNFVVALFDQGNFSRLRWTFLLFLVTTSKNQDLANPLFLFRALFSIGHPLSSIKASIFIVFAHFLLLSNPSHSPLKSSRKNQPLFYSKRPRPPFTQDQPHFHFQKQPHPHLTQPTHSLIKLCNRKQLNINI